MFCLCSAKSVFEDRSLSNDHVNIESVYYNLMFNIPSLSTFMVIYTRLSRCKLCKVLPASHLARCAVACI